MLAGAEARTAHRGGVRYALVPAQIVLGWRTVVLHGLFHRALGNPRQNDGCLPFPLRHPHRYDSTQELISFVLGHVPQALEPSMVGIVVSML